MNERYQKLLARLPLQLPVQAPHRRHAWHLFVVLHPKRDQIRTFLEAAGVQTGLHYPIPLHLQSPAVFSAGRLAASGKVDQCDRLLKYLVSAEATPALRESGLEPGL